LRAFEPDGGNLFRLAALRPDLLEYGWAELKKLLDCPSNLLLLFKLDCKGALFEKTAPFNPRKNFCPTRPMQRVEHLQ
jgi:hypothetical protein